MTTETEEKPAGPTNQDAASLLLSDLRQKVRSVCVWGSGAIGSSAVFHFARAGIRCVAYDISLERVREIQAGQFASTSVQGSGQTPDTGDLDVTATADWRDLDTANIAVHLICVPTERGAEPSEGPLADVLPRIARVASRTPVANTPPLVVVESTILPSWLPDLVVPALESAGLEIGKTVLVGAAPRRDWFNDDSHTLETLPRIVGGWDEPTTDALKAFYGLVCDTIVPAADAQHAAFTKVIENAIRYEGITLANRLALAFPQFDMRHVLRLASTKWNIPYYFPSMGVGGHCIPLAPRYLLAEGGADNPYLDAVTTSLKFNRGYFDSLYDRRLKSLLASKKSIAVLGLAYTPDAKMHKLSPAFGVLETLRARPRLRLHDPFYSSDEIYDLCSVPSLRFPEDLADCDAVILVTPHSVYANTSVEEFIEAGTAVIDNSGIWSTHAFRSGVEYYEVGRLPGRALDDGDLLSPITE